MVIQISYIRDKYLGYREVINLNCDLIIYHGGNAYFPIVMDDITLTAELRGAPEKLEFTVLKDSQLNFVEGDAVSFKVDGKKVFYGFVFSKKRDREQQISVVAYSQIRYLKNKDTIVYTNKTASDLVRMIANDYQLNLGTIEDTSYVIPKKVEDGTTLIDMIQNAIDDTVLMTGTMYVLYDDFGSLCLRSLQSLSTDVLIDASTAENFDYASSIDEETYNKVKLSYKNDETGKRDIYIVQDTENINQWGVLQHYETIDKSVQNPVARANGLLKRYNHKTRKLEISGAFGDLSVRGGSLLSVALNLGEIIVQNQMVVYTVKHRFTENHHTMDLVVKGGVIQ